jgi:NAD(P)-dependent dehydrogenase (short-subunit alcohol dehydrogenase family)
VKFEGKVATVTGAGSGIGEAIALAFAREGADVVIADIDLQSAEKVADKIKSMGRQAKATKVDVSNSQEVSQLVKETLDKFATIDILVNNAGIDKMAPAEELTEADWDSMINVNLKGAFLCSQAVGRQMIKQKRGKIVNILSTGAHIGGIGQAAYCASKGGVFQLTKVLALEWVKYGINVNSVSPGTTMTPLLERLSKEYPDRVNLLEKVIPLRRLNRPEDITGAVLFLASPEADNIVGQDILVDGGLCAGTALPLTLEQEE